MLSNFLTSKTGNSAIEFALIAFVIAVGIVGAIQTLAA